MLNMIISRTYISNFALIWNVPQPAENNAKRDKKEPEQRNSELIIMIHLKYSSSMTKIASFLSKPF